MINLSNEGLELFHHEEFHRLIQNMDAESSEYSFSNLYLFRRQHDYRVLRADGYIFLQGITYDNVRYLMPFTPINEMDIGKLRNLMQDGTSLFPVLEKDLHLFPESEFEYSFNRDDSDYLYTREKIQLYPGRNLHKKRNLVKQYRTLYSYEDRPYSCGGMEDAYAALEKWLEISETPIEDTDFVACAEAMKHCLEFKLSGQLYYADGQPAGFLLGEQLNHDTFVIHFAKGVTMFKGIYPHMYNSLAQTLPDHIKYINFEQDLGKESLRQAKSTYIQDSMVDKYRVKLKR